MTRSELQTQLKKFRSLGYDINVKLNAKTVDLQVAYDAIIAAQEQATDEAIEVETEMENQEAYQDNNDWEYIEPQESIEEEFNKPKVVKFQPRKPRKLIRKGRKNLSILKQLYSA